MSERTKEKSGFDQPAWEAALKDIGSDETLAEILMISPREVARIRKQGPPAVARRYVSDLRVVEAMRMHVGPKRYERTQPSQD